MVGWWFQPTPLKNDGLRQWEDDDSQIYYGKKIPNILNRLWGKKHVPNHQPVMVCV